MRVKRKHDARQMKNMIALLAVALMMAACERGMNDDEGMGTRLRFVPTTADLTRGEVNIGDYFSKLNVMLFNANGEKVWDKVRTQTVADADFGTINVALEPATYTVVAVGHSSAVSASIKSTEMVQFTARDGKKNTDTFCYYGDVTVTEDGGYHEMRMNRVTAMLRFILTDEEVPAGFDGIQIDYTGGSANFNPATGDGCTKSSQSEFRSESSEYQCYTFPYMSNEGLLKVTLSALDAEKNVLAEKTITDVPVTRNRITTYTGPLFSDGQGQVKQTAFGVTINGDWAGEDHYIF